MNTIQGRKMDDIDTCKVCMETYDKKIRPRSLMCGHSFCSGCLKHLLKKQKLSCPKCQRSHKANHTNEFPINYDLEEMISKLREVQESNVIKPSQVLSSKMQLFVDEQLDDAGNLLEISNDVISKLMKYKNFLLERKTEHRELLPKIYELAAMNEDIVSNIENEHSRITETQTQGEECMETLTRNLSYLKLEYSISAIGDLDKSCDALENWNKSSLQEVTEATTITSSSKVLKTTTAALAVLNKECDDEVESEVLDILGIFPPSLLEKLENINGCHIITLGKLQSKTKETNTFLEDNQVYALQQHQGNIRTAKISLQNNKIYLHYLRNEEPPMFSCIVKQSELVGALGTDSVTAFLDLAWNGSTQGRVHILLYPDTPLARQFRILCTGEKGPSYAFCKFLEVTYKNDPTSQGLKTGDYESNDGSGGAPVVSGLKMKDKQYRRPHVAGIVWASDGTDDGPKSSQFTITTGGYHGNYYNSVFGSVVDGLDVVKAAAMERYIGSVKIVDCGVVLPL